MLDQVVEVVDRFILGQLEAVHIDRVSVDARLVKDEVRDASEAQRLELMLVTVGLEDLSDFFDGQLVVVWLLIEWPQFV